MSKGVYNKAYFDNNPEDKNKEGILYCVVLVNKKTNQRECYKVGIAKGKNWKDVLKRSTGFKVYEARIQKVVSGTLYEVWQLEQFLHASFKDMDLHYKPDEKFGGWTECFKLSKLVINSIPDEIPTKFSS